MANQKQSAKNELLDEIIADLEQYQASGQCENMYALEANLTFFRSLYSFWDFWRWFRKIRPTLDGSRLLELSDFRLSDGKWERMLQRELLEIEQWKFPDILGRIRKEILKQIEALNQPNRHLILVSLGSGSMEIERQLITKLRERGNKQRIIFIGIDNSKASIDIAKENLSKLGTKSLEVSGFNPDKLSEIKALAGGEQYYIVHLLGEEYKIIDSVLFSDKTYELTEVFKNFSLIRGGTILATGSGPDIIAKTNIHPVFAAVKKPTSLDYEVLFLSAPVEIRWF